MLGLDEILKGVAQKILLGDTKAVTQQRIVRHLFHADLRSKLRLENLRTVIPEIDKFASRIVAVEITPRCWLPIPCFLDVMCYGSHPDLSALMLIDRTALLFRIGFITNTRGTTFAHGKTFTRVGYALIIR